MKKTALLIIGIGLVGMAPPATQTATSAGDSAGGYPPCSKTVTDRCIQLYERGVATPTNLALNRSLGPGRMAGMGGPEEAPAWGYASTASAAPNWTRPERQTSYPPCSRTVTDRCIQLYERGIGGERG